MRMEISILFITKFFERLFEWKFEEGIFMWAEKFLRVKFSNLVTQFGALRSSKTLKTGKFEFHILQDMNFLLSTPE